MSAMSGQLLPLSCPQGATRGMQDDTRQSLAECPTPEQPLYHVACITPSAASASSPCPVLTRLCLCWSRVCRVHVARSLQDGATYAAKVLPKAAKKRKARIQLQSELSRLRALPSALVLY